MKYFEIKKYLDGELLQIQDPVIEEQEVAIYIDSILYITLMCLQENLKELAVGFLFSEGIISSFSDISCISVEENSIYVILKKGREILKSEERIKTTGYASTGIARSFYTNMSLSPIKSIRMIGVDDIKDITNRFSSHSRLFIDTGAVHSCQLIFEDNSYIFYDDVGRHNAVDKVTGRVLIEQLSAKDSILITSGRISSEMLMKTVKLGAPILISTSAPTDLAITLARETDITLIGFSRSNRFNVYSSDYRIEKTSSRDNNLC